MSGRQIVVETGLDERAGAVLVENGAGERRVVPRTRHARTRFVEPVVPPEPELVPGDRWCPLTVRARLERTAEAYSRLPRPGPRRNPGSCMPETVREMWKDAAKEPSSDAALKDRDLNAAHQIVDVLTGPERAVAWAIAQRWGDSRLGRTLGVSHHTAAARKQQVLVELARQWNGQALRPDREDINRALRFIHRDF